MSEEIIGKILPLQLYVWAALISTVCAEWGFQNFDEELCAAVFTINKARLSRNATGEK